MTFSTNQGATDFMIGKALNEENFRILVREALKTIRKPSETYEKIVEELTKLEFSFDNLNKHHGRQVCAFAMELANQYVEKKLATEHRNSAQNKTSSSESL